MLAFVNLYDTDVERMWVTLASSLDGLRWQRPYRSERFLDLGTEGGWDDSWVNMSDSPPVREGDRMRFWYHGREEAHGLKYRSGGIGTFVLGLDRFAGLSAGREAGWIVTDRVVAGGDRLFLNANVRNGWAKVEVRTSNGTPDSRTDAGRLRRDPRRPRGAFGDVERLTGPWPGRRRTRARAHRALLRPSVRLPVWE